MTKISSKISKINNLKYIKIKRTKKSELEATATHTCNGRLYRIIEDKYPEGIFTYYYADSGLFDGKYFGYTMSKWVLHREDGPAVENEDKSIINFYLEDMCYNKENYFNKLTSEQKYDAIWNL